MNEKKGHVEQMRMKECEWLLGYLRIGDGREKTNAGFGLNYIRTRKRMGEGDTKKARTCWGMCKVCIRISVEKSTGVHSVLYRFRFLVSEIMLNNQGEHEGRGGTGMTGNGRKMARRGKWRKSETPTEVIVP